MNRAVITIIVIAVIAAGVWWAVAGNDNGETNNTVTPPPPPSQQNNNGDTNGDVISGEATVNMTSTGFSPSNITVRKGTTVTFVNQDTKAKWPASAPHPTHTDYPAFDPKQGVAAGQSWEFTFDQTGEWAYHDHLFPSQFGRITVVE